MYIAKYWNIVVCYRQSGGRNVVRRRGDCSSAPALADDKFVNIRVKEARSAKECEAGVINKCCGEFEISFKRDFVPLSVFREDQISNYVFIIKAYRGLGGTLSKGEFVFFLRHKSDWTYELEMVNDAVQWTEILAISSFKASLFTLFAPCDEIFLIRRQIISKVYQWFGPLWSRKECIIYFSTSCRRSIRRSSRSVLATT